MIRIAIVEDHPGVRSDIKKLLETAVDIIVIGEGANGVDALQISRMQQPDILLLDVELPVLRGDEVVRRLRSAHSMVKVLAISSHGDRLHIQGMMENGASGYITKDEAPNLLVEAVRRIYAGDNGWISPQALKSTTQPKSDEQPLTQRETDILQQLLSDKSEYEISRLLEVDERQIEKYLQLLRVKFGVASNAALKHKAQRILSGR